MRKYRNVPSFEIGDQEYVTVEDYKNVLDDIESRINLTIEDMDSGYEYLSDVYKELQQMALDLY